MYSDLFMWHWQVTLEKEILSFWQGETFKFQQTVFSKKDKNWIIMADADMNSVEDRTYWSHLGSIGIQAVHAEVNDFDFRKWGSKY